MATCARTRSAQCRRSPPFDTPLAHPGGGAQFSDPHSGKRVGPSGPGSLWAGRPHPPPSPTTSPDRTGLGGAQFSDPKGPRTTLVNPVLRAHYGTIALRMIGIV